MLGRGITNSRSNYDVACGVALGEALNNSRFTMLAAALDDAGVEPERAEALLERLELRFREQQYRGQLASLRECLLAHADRLPGSEAVHAAVVDRSSSP